MKNNYTKKKLCLAFVLDTAGGRIEVHSSFPAFTELTVFKEGREEAFF